MPDFEWMPGRDLATLKRKAAERFEGIAKSETPDDITIEYRKSLSGCAWVPIRKMSVPKPRTRRALHIYLHEVAHIVLDHRRQKPRHVEELEAEQWATATMRKHGVPVPRKTLKDSKAHVARAIRKAKRRGAKQIDRKATKYAELPLKKMLNDFFS
jgi:hypothetical protein